METSRRVHKMGKYPQAFCRRCSLVKASNHQHVKATRNPKDSMERRHSGAHNCAGQFMRRDRAAQEVEETSIAAHGSAARATTGKDAEHGDDSRRNCGNCYWECRSSQTIRAAGKEERYRGKTSRSRSLAAEQRIAMGLLTRSTSCGDVCSVDGNEPDSEINSGVESPEVHVKHDHTATCVECEGESMLGRYKGVGSDSMLDLNWMNKVKEDAKGNQLGLEVMLSLINGPMQSVIDSKDEKIRNLERAVERLECENKQTRHVQKPGDATKIFTLEKTLESCVRQIEQLEEEKKTAHEKVRLLDDLRKNDKECIDILRVQNSDLEMKLSKSDDRVREVEKDRKNQNQRLKQQYENRIEELRDTLRLKDSKLRDFDKIKSRVAKQRQELEEKKNSENELRGTMSEQVLELKRDLQLQQTKSNILEREKKVLEDSLSQSENLQRQDQKSSYVLQMKIVELQEKLEASCRKNEELDKQRDASNARCQLLEDRLKQTTNMQGRRVIAIGGKTTKENLKSSALDSSRGIHTNIEKANDDCAHQRRNEDNFEISGKCPSVLDRHVNDVLRERVVELHDTFYKGHQIIYADDRRSSSDEHIENLSCCDEKSVEKWRTKRENNVRSSSDLDAMEGNLTVSDITSRKMEMVFTGDKRRSSSDEGLSTSSCSSSSRRGSPESSRAERRQLKVLKVRKVSKENITQFQQNAAYIMSLSRQSSVKDVREDPCGSLGRLNSIPHNNCQCTNGSHRPPKEHTCKM